MYKQYISLCRLYKLCITYIDKNFKNNLLFKKRLKMDAKKIYKSSTWKGPKLHKLSENYKLRP